MVPSDKSKMIDCQICQISDLDKQMTIFVLIKVEVLYSRLLYLFKNMYNFIKTLRFSFSFRRKQATSSALLNTAFKPPDDCNSYLKLLIQN